MLRVCLSIAVVGCTVTTQPAFPPPTLPPTPMRIVLAPIDMDKEAYGTTIPPDVRGDLIAWLDNWYQLSIVESPSVTSSTPFPKVGAKLDLDRIRALCKAAREEHVDAIVFTRFVHTSYDPGSCQRWANEWSTSGNVGDCVDSRPSGQTREDTDLTFLALYPAHCVFAHTLEIDGDFRTWASYRDITRSKVPDYLRAFDSEYEVTDERIESCHGGSDRPACRTPMK